MLALFTLKRFNIGSYTCRRQTFILLKVELIFSLKWATGTEHKRLFCYVTTVSVVRFDTDSTMNLKRLTEVQSVLVNDYAGDIRSKINEMAEWVNKEIKPCLSSGFKLVFFSLMLLCVVQLCPLILYSVCQVAFISNELRLGLESR